MNNTELLFQVKGIENRMNAFQASIHKEMEGFRSELQCLNPSQHSQDFSRISNLEETVTDMKVMVTCLDVEIKELVHRFDQLLKPPVTSPIIPLDPTEKENRQSETDASIFIMVKGKETESPQPFIFQLATDWVTKKWQLKLELSVFEGKNLDGWVFRAEDTLSSITLYRLTD